MMPIHQRIVETDAHAFGSGSIDIFAHEIAARPLLWRTVVRGLGIEVAKAFVMLGGHHHVAHAGSARDLGPIAGGKGLGFELLCERRIFGNRNAFILHDPLMAAKHTVKPPVNEHANLASCHHFMRRTRSASVAAGAVWGWAGP